MSIEKGVSVIDRRILSDADFDWREYDVEDERSKVRPASDFIEEVLASYRGLAPELMGATWPWNKANDKGLRFRPGEVTLYAGVNGNRKSMLTSQIALWLMKQNQPVLIQSFEMRPRATIDRMLHQAAGARPSDAYAHLWELWSNGRLWLYDHFGQCDPRKVLAVARYAVKELGVQHLLIDSLMKVIADGDDYNGQKRFTGSLCALAQAHDVHVHLVAHARKGKNASDGIDKWDVKGASEIVDQVDNCVLVNKKDDAAEGDPNQWVEVAKQRNGEYEGTMGLFFDGKSLSFSDDHKRQWWGISTNVLRGAEATA